MKKTTLIHATFKVQVDEDTQNHTIRNSFDNTLLMMCNLNPLPIRLPVTAYIEILGVKTTHVNGGGENASDKHLIVNMSVRGGMRTYNTQKVVTVPNKMSNADIEKKVIFDAYGETEPEDNAYYYDSGEIAVVCNEFKEITKEEFEVLSKFL